MEDREKIARKIHFSQYAHRRPPWEQNWDTDKDIYKEACLKLADQILKELGYRKPGRLLSEKEGEWVCGDCEFRVTLNIEGQGCTTQVCNCPDMYPSKAYSPERGVYLTCGTRFTKCGYKPAQLDQRGE